MELRPLRAIKKMEEEIEELRRAEEAAEEAARFEIVQSASRFSRRSREVVDSTMSLSATLMRAGEVDEANRLLADAHKEVRTEEAALLESVNEVKVQKAQRTHRISRLRFFKTLATVALGSSLIMSSAFGVVLTNYLVNRPDRSAAADELSRDRKARPRDNIVKRIPVGGMKLELTPAQLKEYKQIVEGRVDRAKLRDFLEDVLADPTLADQIHAALVATASVDVAEMTEPITTQLKSRYTRQSAEAQADEETQPSPGDEPDESPSASESPDEPGEPDDSPEPSPEPNPTPPEDGGEKGEHDEETGLDLFPDEDGG
ncbi:MAG: hypothetical protein ACRDLB_01605 [Actinomycetota bacterium]